MRTIAISICLMAFLCMVIPEDFSPKDALYYFNRAELKREQKNFSGAYSDYTKAINIDQNFIQAYWKRGLLEVDMDSLKKAVWDFTYVIANDPRDEVYYNRARIRYRLQDSIGACSDWKSACDLGYGRACDMIWKHCK